MHGIDRNLRSKTQAQENLPEDEHDEVKGVVPLALPEAEPDREKVEMSGSTSLPPHEGQAALSFSSFRRQMDSKSIPHFLHLNS